MAIKGGTIEGAKRERGNRELLFSLIPTKQETPELSNRAKNIGKNKRFGRDRIGGGVAEESMVPYIDCRIPGRTETALPWGGTMRGEQEEKGQ